MYHIVQLQSRVVARQIGAQCHTYKCAVEIHVYQKLGYLPVQWCLSLLRLVIQSNVCFMVSAKSTWIDRFTFYKQLGHNQLIHIRLELYYTNNNGKEV